MKKADIMAMNDDELRVLAIEQQRKIERLYKTQVKLKRNIEAKQAVIVHLQNKSTRHIVEAVQRLIPLKPSGQ
ncbi:hypothetical protein [Prosthecochloris sp.]|uniref:hypothetical protein n=1 Tax=Prosthecochloris sp. TaxID=290513 RepID=UPI0025E9368E|nr:hypothetical protein [Prosthecochloris sp.]